MIGTAEEKRDGPWWASSRDYRYDYEYDLAGNRTDKAFDNTMTVSGGFYEFNDFNQLVYCEDSSETWFTYDLNGNLIKKQVIDEDALHYHHNRENRLVAFGVIDEHEELIGVYYTYDHTGRLLMRTDSAGNKTKYYYDGINNLLLKEKPTGATCWRTKRIYALQQASIGQVLATRDYSYSGTSCTPADHLDTWYKYNDVGNVIATLDYDGNITQRIDMESFGTVHKGGGYDTPRLTTKEYDADSKLYYFGARWYDKEQGRWIQQEPAGFDGPNWYHFNFNNPVMNYDFDGYSSIDGDTGLSAENKLGVLVSCALSARSAANRIDPRRHGYRGADGKKRNPNNAMRHCVVTCCAYRILGEWGREYIDNREEDNEYPLDAKMDLHNNAIGEEVARCGKSCEEGCAERLIKGDLMGGISPIPE